MTLCIKITLLVCWKTNIYIHYIQQYSQRSAKWVNLVMGAVDAVAQVEKLRGWIEFTVFRRRVIW